MRRIITLCITLSILAFALVGCGGKNLDPAAAEKPATKTSTEQQVRYPKPISFTGYVNDGYCYVKGTPIKLVGEMQDISDWRLHNLRVAALGKKTKVRDINNNWDRYGNDTQFALIDGRYRVHVDGLSETDRTYYGTVWDYGPGGGEKYKMRLLKVPFGINYRIPGTDLVVHSELNGTWRYYELFASVDGTMSTGLDLNNPRSVPIADSRLRLVDDRYQLHVEGLSKQPRKYFILGVIDLGNRYEHKYVTVWENKPTKIGVFGSQAVVTFKRYNVTKHGWNELRTARLPNGKTVEINGWEPVALDTVKVTEARYNPNGVEAIVLDVMRLE